MDTISAVSSHPDLDFSAVIATSSQKMSFEAEIPAWYSRLCSTNCERFLCLIPCVRNGFGACCSPKQLTDQSSCHYQLSSQAKLSGLKLKYTDAQRKVKAKIIGRDFDSTNSGENF
jgi:hypothetical protein